MNLAKTFALTTALAAALSACCDGVNHGAPDTGIDTAPPVDGSPTDTTPTGDAADGATCTHTATDPMNCGTCGNACPGAANATATCVAGVCGFACASGYHVCGAACASNASAMTCGASCTPCAVPANGAAACDGTSCGTTCNAGYVLSNGACVPAPPRQIAPGSTSYVTSQRPQFRWVTPASADGAHVDVCRDRACAMVVTTLDAMGNSATPTAPLPQGVLYWRLRARSNGVTGALTSPTWEFVVTAENAPVNTSWGSMLDLNGDGFADVAVSAPDYQMATGRVHVYYGGPSGIPTTPSVTITGATTSTETGAQVASAGDVNGDGFGDLVAGGQAADSSSGRAFVFLGSPTGISAVPSITLRSQATDANHFGIWVGGAGDVNADGYADVIVGANRFAPSGQAYIFDGSAIGTSTTPSTTLSAPEGVMTYFGLPSVSAGDVNGDGYGDVIIGAVLYSNTIGRAYVYHGGANGPGATPATILTGMDGEQAAFGYDVACAGDVNGDGYSDVVVGAHQANMNRGAAYVYAGSATGVATTPMTSIPGPDGTDGHFAVTVASAGDVNNDGFGDVAIGAWGVNNFAGRVYVYAGSATGLATAAIRTLDGRDGANARFGFQVANAGDVNGDGVADLIVGAAMAGISNTGAAYLFAGNATTWFPSTPSVSLVSPDGVDSGFGTSVALLSPAHRALTDVATWSCPFARRRHESARVFVRL